ncbi:MAG: leucyl/phenylalanyl-tRNA--protein transferase [Burkholderiales bacterium]
MIPWLEHDSPFPATSKALREPNGLLAAGGDLSPARLVAAYSQGIFPWFNEDEPILWWSPDPRMVLLPAELRIARSLEKTLRKNPYAIRADTDFAAVMQGCAGPRRGHPGTWITPFMREAYGELHRQGLAHSVEAWSGGELAGGLYGVALGRVFFGESMFARRTDASKIAFVHLVKQLSRWGYELIDCQMKTAHLSRFGAREIPRREFTRKLAELINYGGIQGKWCFDHDLFE